MNDGYPAAESVVKPHQCLIGQRDLRDQNDCLLSLRDDLPDHLDIHLGLSASGDSLNQKTAVRTLPDPGKDPVRSRPLLLIELYLLMGKCLIGYRIPVLSGPLDPDITLLYHRPDHRACHMQLSGAHLIRKPLFLKQSLHQAKPCLLMETFHLFRFLLCAVPVKRQTDDPFLSHSGFLSRRKHGPQG